MRSGRGWLPVGLVALCFALGVVARGLNDSFSVFVPPLQAAFDADRASITGIYGASMLGIGFGGPLAGWLVDRLGPRGVAVGGVLCAGATALLAPRADALWQLYGAIGVGLGGSSAALGGVFQATILGRWFTDRLGTALAVAYSANGVGVMLIAPLAQRLIEARDWRFALSTIGFGVLALAPLVLLLPWRRIAAGDPAIMATRAAGATGAAAGRTVAQALRDPPFWNLTVTFALTSVAIYVLTPQVNAYLIQRGFTPAGAADAYALMAVLMPVGMIGFNWLADRGGRVFGAVAAYACTAVGIAALWWVRGPADWIALGAFVVLFGSTMGSRGPMIATLAAIRYRGPHLGRIYGLVTFGMGVGAAAGAWLGGLAYDLTGGYGGVFALSLTALGAGATGLVWETRARTRPG
ncbi:MAG: MFS transporter [Rhodospirillales bacterium]|nr:MAG: MFS transporter [Rhodospirillales bacterium]